MEQNSTTLNESVATPRETQQEKLRYQLALRILILMIVIVSSLLVMALIFYSRMNNQLPLTSPVPIADNKPTMNPPAPNPVSSPITENQQSWPVYNYDFNYINPTFAVSYPEGWSFSKNENSAAWDITLTKNNQTIQVDFSGNGQSTFEEAVEVWMSDFGKGETNSTFTSVGSGTADGAAYKKFLITRSNGSTYYIAIINATEIYGGNGHLAIKVSASEMQGLLEEMILRFRKTNST